MAMTPTTFTRIETEALYRLSAVLRVNDRIEDANTLSRLARTTDLDEYDELLRAAVAPLRYVMEHASTSDLSLLAHLMAERVDAEAKD